MPLFSLLILCEFALADLTFLDEFAISLCQFKVYVAKAQ